MELKCKYCGIISGKRVQLFKHYRLKHGSYTRTVPFPCLHQDCLCTFKSLNSLKAHIMVSTHLNMNMFCFYMFQVCLEFSRVVGKSLRQDFYEALDHHSPRLIEIFKAKRGLTGQVLADLMRQTKVS